MPIGNAFDLCSTSSHFAGWKKRYIFELYNSFLYYYIHPQPILKSIHHHLISFIYNSKFKCTNQIKSTLGWKNQTYLNPASISADRRKGRSCSVHPAQLLLRSEAAAQTLIPPTDAAVICQRCKGMTST